MLRRTAIVSISPLARSQRVVGVTPLWSMPVVRSTVATPFRSYASKATDYEKEEFESDISPELIKKFEDVQVTPQLRSKVTTAPAHLSGKAGVLAMRLFENASAFNEIDSVGADLNKLHRLAMKNEDFDNFLRDKAYQKSVQHQVFHSVLNKSPRVLQRFIALNVVEEGNVARLLKIVDNFNELLTAHRKEVDVNITVASPMKTGEYEKLKAQIVANLPAGSNPNWKLHVKPEIGGGVIVDAGDYYNIDESRATQEAELARRVDLILTKARARLIVDPPYDVPKYTSDLEAKGKQSTVLLTPEQLEKRRAAIVASDKAAREAKQDEFKKHFVDWV
eukprot:TRINITY_DN336_c0_g1_i1.p1 TRINITY_DN336_c0_g1~~TRINITY_DN336_c0_g1_i1.p1  ORF type:complete len:335 (-),score=86.99 TRINITY_DN336_c0_g1_i1:84-1088(-)